MNKYTHRKTLISTIIIFVCCIYIARLFYMQVVDFDSFQRKSMMNSQRIVTEYPARGLIFDRNGKLLVENQSAYDLMVIPRQLKKFDTTELINILGIEKETLVKNMLKCRRYSSRKASVLISQITADKFAILQEKLHKYPGFEIQTRTLRKYNVNHSADVFGYIGEVNQSQIKRDSNYALGDYIGINGLERTYEEKLRGRKGETVQLVDKFNRPKGSYKDGLFDKPAIVGKDLTSTLDIDLQEYAYKLMKNKRGAIVAIEPATGEILLKISSPGYDPQLMVGLERGDNYKKLQNDPSIPLLDRSVGSSYPPGSTFKILQALYGLKEGVVTPATQFECIGKARTPIGGGLRMGCHNHDSPLNMYEAIETSCNPYFVQVWRRILENNKYENVRDSYKSWRDFICSFGLGEQICPNFANEISGSVPTIASYDKTYTKVWRWTYIMSLSIGQGELLLTPLQIANMACVIANRGYYITPHIVRPIEGIDNKVKKHTVDCAPEHFDVVVEGMAMAANGGTARRAALDSIQICGKTGTAQNPHGEDHSIFMTFAPKDNPQIVISVYIENGGFGSAYAVPIAGLLLEKYLTGGISPKKKAVEKQMMEADLITPKTIKEKES